MRKTVASLAIAQLLGMQISFADTATTLPARPIQVPSLAELSVETKTRIEGLVIKHGGGTVRPESCPLASEKHIDILSKIESIKNLFKDNCLDADQNRLDQILAGATDLQTELDNVEAAASGSGTGTGSGSFSSATLDVGGVNLNGQEIANIVGNINQIYKDRSCKTLNNNQSFLEKASGFISDFAKIGLLVPNTYALAVAGGGIALSSILLILNSLFERRFNFDKTSDRQSFIKLNCAFYDIRRDIEKSGFLDVPTAAHRTDRAEVEELNEALEGKVEELNKSLEGINKALDEDKTAYLEAKMGVLKPLGETLEKAQASAAKPLTNVTEKLTVIRELTLLYTDLSAQVQQYINLGLGDIPVMDMLFLQELRKLDHIGNPQEYMDLINMSVADFKSKYMASLIFHFNRLEEGSAGQKEKFSKEWVEIAEINGLSHEDYLKQLAEEFKEKSEAWSKLYADLSRVETRLKRILDADTFSSQDDGSENIVTILSDYDTIVEQIYGKFGEKFLEYTTEKSQEVNKDFVGKFKKFARDHLVYTDANGDETVGVRDASEIGRMRVMFACQDAKPFRRKWKYGESLAQQGYDFVATNADLFHADIPRIFLGRSGGRVGIHNWLSKFEKIQMHHKSAIYAQDKLAGKPVSRKNAKRYLRKKYLGKAMLEVKATQPYAELLQEVVEKYDCTKATQMQ